MAWARWVSIAVIPLAALLSGAAVVALRAGIDDAAISWLILTIFMSLPALVLGHLITRRFPRHSVGALLSLAGLFMLAAGTNDTYLAAAQIHPDLPVNNVLISLTQGTWMLLYLPWALMLLVYPSGRLQTPGGARIAGGLVSVTVVFAVFASLSSAPYFSEFQEQHRGLGPMAGTDVAAVLLLPIFLALLVLSFVNVTMRFRAANSSTRNQIRWLAVAGVSIPATLLLCWIGYLVYGNNAAVVVGLAVMNILIPCILGMAVLRSVLLEAGDVLVSLVSAIILLGIVLTWSVLLMRWPGVESTPAAVLTVAAVAGGTLLVAGQRSRIRRRVGRVLYAEHEHILDSIASLQERVFADAARPTELESVLRNATQDPTLRLGFAGPDEGTFRDVHGNAVDGRGGIPVTLAGRVAGVIIPGLDHGRAINVTTVRAMSRLLEMGRQQLELAAALAEVDASRNRLLLASHEERRRLERDLHDGAQQRLVAVGMGLRLVQQQLPPGSEELRDKLDLAVTELGTAVAELRQIAHGVRPTALDDGLPAALRQLSGRSPTQLDLKIAESLPDMPEIVGSTAYFVASEAVHNALRHAQAEHVSIVLEQRGDSISLTVSDDGRGGARSPIGGGLAGLIDRVNAVGGRLSLTSPAGLGTTIEATLPCG